MPSLMVFAERIERKVASEALPLDWARQLQLVDLRTTRGALERAKGVVRVNFASGASSNVLSCGVFQRADGVWIMVMHDAGGVLRAQVDPGNAYADSDF